MGLMDSIYNTAAEVGDWASPALHVVEGLAEGGVLGAGAREAGEAVPLLGTAVGLGMAGVNIGAAIMDTDEEKRWDHIGGAALSALGAIPAVGT